MKRYSVALLGSIILAALACTAMAHAGADTLSGPNGEHKVVVCKYVGTPGTDERLQTGQNPIVVDYHALLGDGFAGVFPFAFSDAQSHSVAVLWTFDEHFSDLGVCPDPVGPPPCTEDCGPPPCTTDCEPPPCGGCPPPECLTAPGCVPCDVQVDCSPPPPPSSPPPCADCRPRVPTVPKAPTLKQYVHNVNQGKEAGGG